MTRINVTIKDGTTVDIEVPETTHDYEHRLIGIVVRALRIQTITKDHYDLYIRRHLVEKVQRLKAIPAWEKWQYFLTLENALEQRIARCADMPVRDIREDINGAGLALAEKTRDLQAYLDRMEREEEEKEKVVVEEPVTLVYEETPLTPETPVHEELEEKPPYEPWKDPRYPQDPPRPDPRKEAVQLDEAIIVPEKEVVLEEIEPPVISYEPWRDPRYPKVPPRPDPRKEAVYPEGFELLTPEERDAWIKHQQHLEVQHEPYKPREEKGQYIEAPVLPPEPMEITDATRQSILDSMEGVLLRRGLRRGMVESLLEAAVFAVIGEDEIEIIADDGDLYARFIAVVQNGVVVRFFMETLR